MPTLTSASYEMVRGVTDKLNDARSFILPRNDASVEQWGESIMVPRTLVTDIYDVVLLNDLHQCENYAAGWSH